MIEFRTIIKIVDKESVVSSMNKALEQLSQSLRIHTEENDRIVLICIFFDSTERARKFLDLVLREDIELNSWALYEDNRLIENNK
jgi:hypothetical protein